MSDEPKAPPEAPGAGETPAKPGAPAEGGQSKPSAAPPHTAGAGPPKPAASPPKPAAPAPKPVVKP